MRSLNVSPSWFCKQERHREVRNRNLDRVRSGSSDSESLPFQRVVSAHQACVASPSKRLSHILLSSAPACSHRARTYTHLQPDQFNLFTPPSTGTYNPRDGTLARNDRARETGRQAELSHMITCMRTSYILGMIASA